MTFLMPIDCDQPETIARHLGSLTELHALLASRREAMKAMREGARLREFVILKRYVLSAFNGLDVLQTPIDDPKMPDVVPMEEVKQYLRRGEHISYSGCWLPTDDDRCKVCARPFNLVTASTAIKYQDEPAFSHGKCAWIESAELNRRFFADIFRAAGFEHFYMFDIENGYWPEPYAGQPHYTPWFHVHTPVGKLTVGWRKRVISISWAETNRDLLALFPDEDTTKETMLIHAWSKDKAIEYLTKIREALS